MFKSARLISSVLIVFCFLTACGKNNEMRELASGPITSQPLSTLPASVDQPTEAQAAKQSPSPQLAGVVASAIEIKSVPAVKSAPAPIAQPGYESIILPTPVAPVPDENDAITVPDDGGISQGSQENHHKRHHFHHRERALKRCCHHRGHSAYCKKLFKHLSRKYCVRMGKFHRGRHHEYLDVPELKYAPLEFDAGE